MTIVKSFSVGRGDFYYIQHNSDSFTIIDCYLTGERDDELIAELKQQSKGVCRFISTHPDEDHFGGIEKLDAAMPIRNFYVVKNDAQKEKDSISFKHYCQLRDGDKAFYLHKGCKRKWLNKPDENRSAAGISVLWPDLTNDHFKEELAKCNSGVSYNNVSPIIRYSKAGGGSVLWLGDLETQYMENIYDSIELSKTTVVFAAHHGRDTGKIPDSWLQILEPQIVIIGEAPSRHLNYYTGYQTITQNSAGDITMEMVDGRVHFSASNIGFNANGLIVDPNKSSLLDPFYCGSIDIEQ